MLQYSSLNIFVTIVVRAFSLCLICAISYMFKGPCDMISPERLDCVAPNITTITGFINDTQVVVELGFVMQRVNSVEIVRNISVRGDPYFEKFVGTVDLQQNNLYLKVRP